MTFKKAVGKIHLWLGLASGLVVFIVSITGCIFAFQKEISEAVERDLFFIKPPSAQAQTLPLSTLLQRAEGALDGKVYPNFITSYRSPDRTWEFMAYKDGDEKAFTFFGTVDYYKSAFVNPYTGEITGIKDYKYDFFTVIKYLHWSLLLNTIYGQPIVGWSTFIFVIMLISGLILWWPKKWNKTNIQKSFNIKWSAKFKRINYDLHNVLGFYAMLITLILAFTGLVWAFSWFQSAVYVVASQSVTPPQHKTVKSDTTAVAVKTPLDIAFRTAQNTFPEAERIGVSPATGKEGLIYIYGYRDEETYYDADGLQFDQYTGKLLNRENFKDGNAGEKLISMNYDIHVGAILGLPGKIIAFCASLIAASLPVTGLLIWLGKGRKSAKRSKRRVIHRLRFGKAVSAS
ncbi:PepSY domain-containing protein (plasmid) [Pedobacter sp. BS3]|uniref:PepSY-associated TM helix domain-containing protein n=1 Tax=Pedobacter sp. BS3 TaxID=2567937 RepID=UPI0011ECEBC8|nr:PepSY-associated TM helix domain-containing protein [Pedobacter sp. BS3]TZF86173.1 PepSY domain-containing protein [Pedobacter sp. BS3]